MEAFIKQKIRTDTDKQHGGGQQEKRARSTLTPLVLLEAVQKHPAALVADCQEPAAPREVDARDGADRRTICGPVLEAGGGARVRKLQRALLVPGSCREQLPPLVERHGGHLRNEVLECACRLLWNRRPTQIEEVDVAGVRANGKGRTRGVRRSPLQS